MTDKANSSKKKSQQLKRSPKRKAHDEEMDLLKKAVKSTKKRNTNHPKYLSSEEYKLVDSPEPLLSPETGQTDQTNLKQVKIAPKRRKTWQLLPKTSREYLQSIMEPIIIEILSNHIKEHDQIHYHLNYLKKRLLQLFETLQVPPQKVKDVANMPNLLKMERTHCGANEEDLALLQKEIDKVVETIESMTENIHCLKNRIEILTSQVEEKEEKLKQVLPVDSSGELSLPELSQKSLKAPTLQEEILTLKLNPTQNTLLKDLHVLHNSSKMKNMLTFIEEAYKKLDAYKRSDAIVT